MTTPGSANPLLLASAAGAAPSYQIERSLRFNSSDSGFLSRTFTTPTGNTQWTWAGWVKRSKTASVADVLISANHSSGLDARFAFTSTDTLNFYDVGPGGELVTTAVYRDFSAWMHICFVYDSPNATSTDRLRLYINGTRITSSNGLGTCTYPSQNAASNINAAKLHHIGQFATVTGYYLNGLLADIHFIDSQALTPSSFGEFDTNGVWQPKAYTGSYGTNGFHLPFSDNSTAAALGTDTSGNGNDWTTHNLFANDSGFFRDVNFALGTNTQGATDFPGAVMFDGSDNTGWGAGQTARTNEYTLTTAVAIPAGELWAFVFAGKTGVTVVVENAGGSIVSSPITNIGAYHWLYLGSSPGSIKKIRLVDTNPSYGGLAIYSFRVDSTRLVSIDPGSIVDSLVDTPTSYGTDTGAGGEVRGNYATLNPLDNGGLTLANGNLDSSEGAGSWKSTRAIIGISSGKWYWEVTATSGSFLDIGISKASEAQSASNYVGIGANGWGYVYDGKKYNSGVGVTYGATYTSGDVIGVAFDADNGTLAFYKNNVSQGTAFTGLTAGPYFPAVSNYSSSWACNFGQRPFAFSAPLAFKALCTANLPTPTIEDGSTAMDVKLYTGNGSTQTISGLNFSPDLVWIKGRSTAFSAAVLDTVRGASNRILTASTTAESPDSSSVNAFNSDGWTMGSDSYVNQGSATHVAWCWDAGSSTVTNTQGSITSQVRANASAGFSIVKFTGVSSPSGETVGHGLNAPVQLYFLKGLSNSTDSWIVGGGSAVGFSSRQFLRLNTTDSKGTTTANAVGVPNSSTVYVDVRNYSGQETIAYCFAPVDGYSSFGSYTGNGSADGPFVYTDVLPRWVMIKRTDLTGNWTIIDTAREGYNVDNDPLYPNLSDAEGTTDLADILSNGFKLRTTDASVNASAGTYIYACFGANPFAYSRSR